ncbi:MAG: hypothetical protein ATN35_00205 [Epulopiscium sp. Nele67-Bin004]|nr:MAG: hypothetical protein ATN35_00205 [Epulopiscium sp. Nele67-Bin004]
MIKQLVFPNKCIICRKLIQLGDNICAKCDTKIITQNRCPKCLFPQETDDKCMFCGDVKTEIKIIKSLFRYKGAVKKSIFRWKYSGTRKYGYGYAMLLADHISADMIKDIDALIPTPVSKKRFQKRGFNQALDLANHLGAEIGVPVHDILERHRNTKPQSECEEGEREKNIKNSISIKRLDVDILNISKPNFAIVDDIYTTGSTIRECIKVLKTQYDIENIYVFVVCSTK